MTVSTPPPTDHSHPQGHVRVRVGAAAALLFPPGLAAANDPDAGVTDFASLLENALDANQPAQDAPAARADPATPEEADESGAIVPIALEGLTVVAAAPPPSTPAVPVVQGAEAAEPEPLGTVPARAPQGKKADAKALSAARPAGSRAAEVPSAQSAPPKGAATPLAATARAEKPLNVEPAAPLALAASATPEQTAPAFATPPTAAAVQPHAAELHVGPRVGVAGFDEAFAARVSIAVRSGSETVSITLNPPELGPVRMQIEVNGSEARVHFAAEQPLTREAVTEALPRLREMLAAHGLNLAGSSVGTDLPRREAPAQPAAHAGTGGEPSADAQTQTTAAVLRLVDTFA